MPSGEVSFRRADVDAHGGLMIPCGHCVGCKLSRAREWAIRCDLELQDHFHACWSTLTYEEKYVPPTLDKAALSACVKRLRARFPHRVIRFFGSGEYGERRGRPHYHVIWFGLPCSIQSDLESVWKMGGVQVDPITEGTIPYVAGYVYKKVGGVSTQRIRVDYSTGEEYEYQPPFVLMSRNPGIAARAAARFASSWRKTAMYSGYEVPVPRYLHAAYAAEASPEELALLKDEKDFEAYERTAHRMPERLKAAEQIALSRLSLISERRLVG